MGATIDREATRRPFRALARRPKAVAGVLLALLMAGPWAWWATQLWGLPDVGDPFDIAAFEAERIPDDRNAFVIYAEAAPIFDAAWRASHRKQPGGLKGEMPSEWAKAGPPWRELVADHRAALNLWRVGSERPDARHVYPEGLSFHTLLGLNQSLRMLALVASLEGSRLESEGDLAGAWGWYRAIFKSSRHTGRHGFLLERTIGAAMHRSASLATTRWSSDPRVDAPLLRRALDEVIAIDAATPPLSDALKMEYLVFRNSLHDPSLIDDLLLGLAPGEPADWCQDLPVSDATKRPIQAARVVLADDRERSLRLVRLMTANWLAEVDKPPSKRTPIAHRDPPIYGPDPDAPPSSRALEPEALARWLDSSLLARRVYSFLAHYSRPIDFERARQAKLVVHLASELHRREHGGPPPSPEALVGPYLKALPEGYDAPDEPEARP